MLRASDSRYECFGELHAVLDGLLFEGRVVHVGGVVGLVRDGADDDERHLILPCDLGDGRALHLAAAALEVLDDPVLRVAVGDELVTAADAADEGADLRVHAAVLLLRGSDQTIVRVEGHGADARDLTELVAEVRRVHVVLHRILGEDNVSNVDVRVEGSGDTGVDDAVHREAVDQHRCAGASIDLADAGAHHGDILPVQLTGHEGESVVYFGHCVGDVRLQLLDLFIHCSNNSNHF